MFVRHTTLAVSPVPRDGRVCMYFQQPHSLPDSQGSGVRLLHTPDVWA